jgi:two-component system, NarL family, sensor histidine kinase LiaS
MQAAKTWSRGEFQTGVQDRSPDEVGRLTHDLNAMAGEVQSLLASRQMLAVVDERNRLARELHDTVKQQVFSSALLVHAARKSFDKDPISAQRNLEEAELLHEKIQEALVEALQALRPAGVTEKRLAIVLREYVEAWGARHSMEVDLTIQLAQSLPSKLEETLYRVAQEALANIARHSGAQKVEIRIEQDRGEVTMTIGDNGHGFDLLDSFGKGSGMTNMRERVELAGGKFDLSSSPSGTILAIRISRIEPQISA